MHKKRRRLSKLLIFLFQQCLRQQVPHFSSWILSLVSFIFIYVLLTDYLSFFCFSMFVISNAFLPVLPIAVPVPPRRRWLHLRRLPRPGRRLCGRPEPHKSWHDLRQASLSYELIYTIHACSIYESMMHS